MNNVNEMLEKDLFARAPYTEGKLDASIVLVGEAPGANEYAHGGAFIGPAGELLTKLLSNANINRGLCRLENVFQFHPTKDDLEPYIRFNTRGDAIHTPEFEKAREELRLRLMHTTANVIVPLGNIAMYTLCGQHGILKRRGSIYQSTLLPDRKVIPTIHPSAALRFGSGPKFQEGQRKRAVDPYVYRYWIIQDLTRALSESKFPEIRLLCRDLIVEPGFSQVMDFLRTANDLPCVAFDIEATRGGDSEVTHIAIAKSAQESMCIPFIAGQRDYWSPEQEADIWIALAQLLENPHVVKLAQNAAFDVSFLNRRQGIVVSPIEDTMIATSILYPDFPAGLDFLTSIYCEGEPYYKDDGKQWTKNPFGNEHQFRIYNAKDAAVLFEIFAKQEVELKRTRNWDTYKMQLRLVHPLTFAANKGVLLDFSKLQVMKKQCEKQLEDVTAEWKSCTRVEVNPDSAPQVMNYFYGVLKYKAYLSDGRITCDDRALKMLVLKGCKEADVLLRYRKLAKMYGTYFEMEFDNDNRLRCSYNPVGTEQGRISSSKNIFGTGGNLQNQPPEMRAIQLPDPGYILVSQDLAQAENRVVAYVFGEEKMIAAFENNVDIHKQTGALIAGVAMDAVTDEIRQDGKRANHGLNYDLGAESFAMYYQIPRDRAKFIVERYHAVYPGIREGHAMIRDLLSRENRTLVNCLGRHRTFLGRWGHDLFKVAYSYIPQSTVGMKMNTDGVCILYERQDLFAPVELLNTVHDSILYQVPLSIGLERIIDVIRALKGFLEAPLYWRGRAFSIPTDTELGFSNNKSKMLKWTSAHIEKSTTSALCNQLEELIKEHEYAS